MMLLIFKAFLSDKLVLSVNSSDIIQWHFSLICKGM